MAEHPIQGLMKATLESLKEMIDVNTVVGDPVETQDGQVVIPVSRVTVGFAAGGSEFGNRSRNGGRDRYAEEEDGGSGLPFGGGSGAAVSVQPVGFLVVGRESIRMLSVEGRGGWDKLIELAPQVLERVGRRTPHPEPEAEAEPPPREMERSRRRTHRLERLARRVTETLDDPEDEYR